MKNQLDLFSDFFGKLCHYMVIISPSKEIIADVKRLKERLAEVVGSFDSEFSTAHISLDNFTEYENQIAPILRHFENCMRQFKIFEIELNNYSFFDTSRTIYVDIINKDPIKNIYCSLVKKSVDYTPHVTIAKRLEHETYFSLKEIFSARSYTNSFLCDRITILKKPEGQQSWKHFVDIPLGR